MLGTVPTDHTRRNRPGSDPDGVTPVSQDIGAGVPLRASLDGVVRSLRGGPTAGSGVAGAAPSAGAMGGLFRGWTDAVGDRVSAHARPIVLDRGRLVVEVDQPGWATQLRFLEADLVARLRPYVAPAAIDSVEIRVAGAKAVRNRSGRRTS